MTKESGKDDNENDISKSEALIEIYEEYQQISKGKEFTGDGTWTEDKVICAIVTATSEIVALSKAAAAFGCRDDRPETLWDYERTESFEIISEFKTPPRVVANSAWEDLPPVAKAGDDGYDDVVVQMRSVCSFEDNKSIVYDEWGTQITSADALEEATTVGTDPVWIVIGVSLEPTAVGKGFDEYIGSTARIHCHTCRLESAECVNIILPEEMDDHVGIWICEECGGRISGPTPQKALRQDALSFD
ncbi:hypothetical protein [Haloarcula salina]|uniref:Uncharacterized protein n=1 Tax=Haloarcula salina TaxID=1429914 RepID=A0AA41FYY5_9EURY|nr:hypothetical protein [Haloarcula salina]MBV0901355.1 hypothetical protein [Haloarcula salina]